MASPLPEPSITRPAQNRAAHRIERFHFGQPVDAAPRGGTAEARGGEAISGFRRLNEMPAGHAGAEPPADAALRHQIEQAREEGLQLGLQQAQLKFDDDLRRERLAIAHAIEEFAQDRFRYFRRVEREVVELSLSIARRILHRESQLDPLMLQGAVRSVLDRVADSTGSTMRVHPSRLTAWEAWFEKHAARQRPVLGGDPSLAVDQCILETSMGSTDIGVESQLEEIGSGFCDLLAARGADGK